jgi:hypothetical protein
MTRQMDGWMDESREKASRKTTMTFFTICNTRTNVNYNGMSHIQEQIMMLFQGIF